MGDELDRINFGRPADSDDENRVMVAIEYLRQRGSASQEKRLDRGMALSRDEYRVFSRVYRNARKAGVFSSAEERTFHEALGDSRAHTNGGWTKATDTVTKVAMTQIVYQLIDALPGLREP